MAGEETGQAFSCELTIQQNLSQECGDFLLLKRFSEKPPCLLRGLPTMTQPRVVGRMLVTPRWQLPGVVQSFPHHARHMPYVGEPPERSHRFQKVGERFPAQEITAFPRAVWQGWADCAAGSTKIWEHQHVLQDLVACRFGLTPQGYGLIHYFPSAGRCSAISRKAGSITWNSFLRR